MTDFTRKVSCFIAKLVRDSLRDLFVGAILNSPLQTKLQAKSKGRRGFGDEKIHGV
jgi:hypothetical protein